MVESNIRTFVDHWTGTGSINGAGDAETICVHSGEYMISEVVHTGIKTVELDQNHYDVTGDTIFLKYRHGATQVACEAAAWNDYTVPFSSLGYVQVRITSDEWWLAGSVSPSNCVVAYQAKGAASLAASYVNLANPGTYDATEGVAPAFDTATGWTFDIAEYLDTGIIPTGTDWTYIVRYSSALSGTLSLFGSFKGSAGAVLITPSVSSSVRYCHYRTPESKSPALSTGILAMADRNCYRNGVLDKTLAAANTTPSEYSLFVGAVNTEGVAAQKFHGSIQAFAAYNTPLTEDQIEAVTEMMGAI